MAIRPSDGHVHICTQEPWLCGIYCNKLQGYIGEEYGEHTSTVGPPPVIPSVSLDFSRFSWRDIPQSQHHSSSQSSLNVSSECAHSIHDVLQHLKSLRNEVQGICASCPNCRNSREQSVDHLLPPNSAVSAHRTLDIDNHQRVRESLLVPSLNGSGSIKNTGEFTGDQYVDYHQAAHNESTHPHSEMVGGEHSYLHNQQMDERNLQQQLQSRILTVHHGENAFRQKIRELESLREELHNMKGEGMDQEIETLNRKIIKEIKFEKEMHKTRASEIAELSTCPTWTRLS